MSYHIYTTPAFILNSFPAGESDMIFQLCTKELGVLSASARAVRETKSKLRYSLEEGSHINVSFIRGKEVWRIVDASLFDRLTFQESPEKFKCFVSVAYFTVRFIHGEENETRLYQVFEEMFRFLRRHDIPKTELRDITLLSSARVLQILGYFEDEKNIFSKTYGGQILNMVERKELTKNIQEAVHLSHL